MPQIHLKPFRVLPIDIEALPFDIVNGVEVSSDALWPITKVF